LAARHCTRLMMLHEGRLVADGPPVEVLRPETLAAVFGIRAFLGEAEGLPLCQPLEVIG
jgi:iron complex transport system ATP-binding protein